MAEAGGAAGEDRGSDAGGLGNRQPSEVGEGFARAPICHRGSAGLAHIFLSYDFIFAKIFTAILIDSLS